MLNLKNGFWKEQMHLGKQKRKSKCQGKKKINHLNSYREDKNRLSNLWFQQTEKLEWIYKMTIELSVNIKELGDLGFCRFSYTWWFGPYKSKGNLPTLVLWICYNFCRFSFAWWFGPTPCWVHGTELITFLYRQYYSTSYRANLIYWQRHDDWKKDCSTVVVLALTEALKNGLIWSQSSGYYQIEKGVRVIGLTLWVGNEVDIRIYVVQWSRNGHIDFFFHFVYELEINRHVSKTSSLSMFPQTTQNPTAFHNHLHPRPHHSWFLVLHYQALNIWLVMETRKVIYRWIIEGLELVGLWNWSW